MRGIRVGTAGSCDLGTDERAIAWRGWTGAGLTALWFLIGVVAGGYLHWPALTNPSEYKSDMRQAPHWAAYHQTSFQNDDPIVEYARFNESPLQNAIYWVATHFGDMLWVSKVMAVLSYGLLSAIFFAVGRRWYGARFGALLALFITFFPDQFDFSAGFYSKFWIIPLILVAVFLLAKGAWAGLVALMPLGAVAYPVSAVVIGQIVAVYATLVWFEDRPRAAALLRHLALGSAIAIGLLALKYSSPPDFLGSMRPRAELVAMPEMLRGGMNNSPYVPIPSLPDELAKRVWHPFVLLNAVFFFLVLGRRGVAWDKSWTALVLAALVGYVVADLVFMRLYIPNRYTRYSLAVLMALWNARNWDLILARFSSRGVQAALVAALVAIGGYAYQDTFRMGKDTGDRSRYDALCAFVATLPEGALVAGPPRRLDDIMIRSKRSVLTTYKIAHPWFTGYYALIEARTRDNFRALFADNVDPINALGTKYGVTHVVVERDFYGKDLRRRKIYVQPYNDFILRELVPGKKSFLLERPPPESVLFESKKYRVVALPLPTPSPVSELKR